MIFSSVKAKQKKRKKKMERPTKENQTNLAWDIAWRMLYSRYEENIRFSSQILFMYQECKADQEC